ncbi:MAG TPA: AMP-binding protein, partial [Kofleriaceae bacterium]|nr:AMP-binding protein [Kofleriaceae bacterium]
MSLPSSDADLFDVVTAPAVASLREDAVTVELPPADAAGLAALAARLELDPPAIWRAAWALLLARLIGVEHVQIARGPAAILEGDRRNTPAGWSAIAIDVPASGELASWLTGGAAGRPAHSNGAPPRAAGPSGDPTPQSGWADGDRGSGEAGPALVWHVRGGNGGSAAVARFSGARIDRPTVERLGELLRSVMAALVAPGARLETISPLTAAERALTIEEWNRTTREYRTEATVHGLFREEAAARPDRVAILWDGGQLSYGELDRWSDALAERLIAAGVGTDQPVALCLPRSPEAVVAALAILKAGGAYLPLDPDHPTERLAFTIADAGAQVLVTRRARAGALAALAARTVFVDDDTAAG